MQRLDNPVWHALCGPHATLAEGSGDARRYRREFAPFAALGDASDPAAWAALADTVGPGEVAVIVPEVEPRAGWQLLRSFGVHQMVYDGRAPDLDADAPAGIVTLDAIDVPAMTALVAAAEPGPWAERTHELGEFVGMRVDGRLVAMAGQRMQVDGAVEISAVCTDPAYRGHGYARTVVAAMTARTLATGRLPFLHVRVDNVAAISLYERLGFRRRVEFRPGVFQAPGS